MNYIVLDLEWNQCPDGKLYEVSELPFEIFEIGAVKLNENREFVDRFTCYIKPAVYTELHYITRGLTHATMETLNKGLCFSDAISSFFSWCEDGGEYRMCTWGAMDLLELQRNMRYFGFESPFEFPLFFYDVQKLYSIALEDGKSRRALEVAVDALGIEKDIDFHNAINDAEYTARVMQVMDFDSVKQYFSIDNYYIPKDKKSEIGVNYGTYYKYISRGFATKEAIMEDADVLSTNCYVCRKRARKKIRWFTMNTKMHYCLVECKEHGYIKGRFKIKEDEFGNFYAMKILKITDEAGAESIRLRQQEIRRRRRERRKKGKKNNS